MKTEFSFRRKPEENPYEALERLDTKINALMDERHYWLLKASHHAIMFVNKLEKRYRELIAIRTSLLQEIEGRHNSLLELKPNLIEIK